MMQGAPRLLYDDSARGARPHSAARLFCSEMPTVQRGSLKVSLAWIFVYGIGHLHVG
jgi:hypothetical protein